MELCKKNIKTSRLGVANDSSVFLTTLKHSIVSKISPGAVETTLKIGTNNLQKMLILIGRRRRPKKFGLFPPHISRPWGGIFFSPPYSETLGGKFEFLPPHISRPRGEIKVFPPHMGGKKPAAGGKFWGFWPLKCSKSLRKIHFRTWKGLRKPKKFPPAAGYLPLETYKFRHLRRAIFNVNPFSNAPKV